MANVGLMEKSPYPYWLAAATVTSYTTPSRRPLAVTGLEVVSTSTEWSRSTEEQFNLSRARQASAISSPLSSTPSGSLAATYSQAPALSHAPAVPSSGASSQSVVSIATQLAGRPAYGLAAAYVQAAAASQLTR